MKQMIILLWFLGTVVTAKTQVTATFEDLQLPLNSFWNGSDESGKFISGHFTFYNNYNKTWGSWSGFAYSNKTDKTTPGWTNQYSAITGGGVFNSSNYAVGYDFGDLRVTISKPDSLSGVYITNSTYAYLALRDGDAFSKKFGGNMGQDPDYFRLKITGLNIKGDTTGTVTFYLADFRPEDPQKDYIIREWTWVDLSSLGIISELRFSLESTDVGVWGMNTPAYFCLDDLHHQDMAAVVIKKLSQRNFRVYPNPFHDMLSVELPENTSSVQIYDINGRLVFRDHDAFSGEAVINALKIHPPGVYILTISVGGFSKGIELIKE